MSFNNEGGNIFWARQVDRIASALRWIAFWLFWIALTLTRNCLESLP